MGTEHNYLRKMASRKCKPWIHLVGWASFKLKKIMYK